MSLYLCRELLAADPRKPGYDGGGHTMAYAPTGLTLTCSGPKALEGATGCDQEMIEVQDPDVVERWNKALADVMRDQAKRRVSSEP